MNSEEVQSPEDVPREEQVRSEEDQKSTSSEEIPKSSEEEKSSEEGYYVPRQYRKNPFAKDHYPRYQTPPESVLDVLDQRVPRFQDEEMMELIRQKHQLEEDVQAQIRRLNQLKDQEDISWRYGNEKYYQMMKQIRNQTSSNLQYLYDGCEVQTTNGFSQELQRDMRDIHYYFGKGQDLLNGVVSKCKQRRFGFNSKKNTRSQIPEE
jgi:hypothetical protein